MFIIHYSFLLAQITVLSQLILITNLLAKAYLENPHQWQNIAICAFRCWTMGFLFRSSLCL